MAGLVPPGVDAIVFNLGWLPGAQHAVTTREDTTLAAVAQAVGLLAPGGVLTICIYPGHEEGRARTRGAALLGGSASGDIGRSAPALYEPAEQPAGAAGGAPQAVKGRASALP